MSTSGSLRRFLLAPYQPMFHSRDPTIDYKPIYNSGLDLMTTVSSPKGNRRSATVGLYGIRRYRAQVMGESHHPIEKLMKRLQEKKVIQREMQHVLIPFQAFYHADDGYFYTASDHVLLSLAHLRTGTKEYPAMIEPDIIWSIVQQVLAGLDCLTTQGLEHSNLEPKNILITHDGVVKIGAIHHIQDATSTGWVKMTAAVEGLAQTLIKRSKRYCLRCINKSKAGGLECCDHSQMSTRLDSLRGKLNLGGKLNTIQCPTTESTAFNNRRVKGEAIRGALNACATYFTDQTNGACLAGSLAGTGEYASKKGFGWLEPVSKVTGPGRRKTSSLREPNQRRRRQAPRRARERRLYGGLEGRLLNRHAKQTDLRDREKRGREAPPA